MRFSTKLMFAMAGAVVGVSFCLGVTTYAIVARFYRAQFLKAHVAAAGGVRDTFVAIERVTERAATNALLALRERDAAHGVPDVDALQRQAEALGLYNIYFTDAEGGFVRWARDTLKTPERSIFQHCEGYRNLLDAPDTVEQTPIMSAAGDISTGLFKFSLMARAGGKGIIEVSTPADFVSDTLHGAIAADRNIQAVYLFDGKGKLIKSLRASLDEVGIPEFLPPGVHFLQDALYIVTPVASHAQACCECLAKGTMDEAEGAPIYYLTTRVSQAPLLASLTALRQHLMVACAIVCVLGLMAVWRLCQCMLRRLRVLTRVVGDMSKGRLSAKVHLGGQDELTALGGQIEALAQSLEKSQKQLISAARASAMAETASKVAHDIRSPLAALKFIVPSLHALPEDLRSLTSTAVARIEEIAYELLEQRMAPARESSAGPTLVHPLVTSVVCESRLSHGKRSGLTFVYEPETEMHGLCVATPAAQLRRVLSNLLNNAADAIGEYGVVRVRVRAQGDTVTVEIEDTGCGIPAHVLARLGREELASSKAGGNGIGVFISQKMLAAHGGSLDYMSTLGEGTVAAVTLQRVAPPMWLATELPLESGGRVVVLDDDPSIHELWRSRLGQVCTQLQWVHHKSGAALKQWFAADKASSGTIFLVDYELSTESVTGLDVIEELGIGQAAILVTSRFEDRAVQERCVRLNVKILPKAAAAQVPICPRRGAA